MLLPLSTSTPSRALPEITFRLTAPLVPPMMLFDPAKMSTPLWLPAAVPAGLIPIQLPLTVFPPLSSSMPLPPKSSTTSPWMVLPAPPAATVRPLAVLPALVPSSTTTGVPAVQPGCEVPSTTMGAEMLGRAEAGLIVQVPVAA